MTRATIKSLFLVAAFLFALACADPFIEDNTDGYGRRGYGYGHGRHRHFGRRDGGRVYNANQNKNLVNVVKLRPSPQVVPVAVPVIPPPEVITSIIPQTITCTLTAISRTSIAGSSSQVRHSHQRGTILIALFLI